MLALETGIQQLVKVELETYAINDLAAGLPALGREIGLKVGADLIELAQQRLFELFQAGSGEMVCTRCGVIHLGGSGSLLRRGSRPRRLKTSSGVLVFSLWQLTCRDCRRTWSPFAELLGIQPRQRVSEELERKLVDCVTDLSYRKTCGISEAWLGGTLSPRTLHRAVQRRGERVRFTPAQGCQVALVDGTRVPAGESDRGCEIRFALQLLGRDIRHGRPIARKRIASWSLGAGTWSQALPPGIASQAIITDRQPGLAKAMSQQNPGVLHGMCEWHLGHSLSHFLWLDGVKNQERKRRVAELSRLVWGTEEKRVSRFARLEAAIRSHPRATTFLRNARSYVLSPFRSTERTTSLIEREMREINRRTNVGARWSVTGVDHLLRLRQSKRINPDDYDRVWSSVKLAVFRTVPLA